MSNRRFAPTLLTALVLGLATGYATADDMQSSMEEPDDAGMSESMDDATNDMSGDMEDSGDSGMSQSMTGESSNTSGDMDGNGPSMDDDM